MKIQIKKADIIWSYLGSIFQYCTSLFILPIILNEISKGELGLWYSFSSVGMLVTYLDFGFSTTMVRNITYAWSGATKIQKDGVDETSVKEQADINFIKKVLFTCRIVCFVVALVALAIMLSAGTYYIKYITRDFSNQSVVLWAWIIYAVGVFFNIYYNYCGHTLRGIGKISQYQKIVVAARVVQITLSFCGIKLGYGLIGLSVAYFVSGFIIRFCSKLCIDREIAFAEQTLGTGTQQKAPLTERFAEVWALFKNVWFNAKKSGLISVCSYGINQSLTLICSAYLGVEETAAYGLCKQLLTAIMNVAGIMFSTYQPKMINCIVLKQEDKYRKLFSMGIMAFGIISIGGILGVAVLSKPLLALINSNTNIPVGMFLFMGLYMYLEHNHGEYTAYFTMRNNIEYLPSYIVSSVLIVGMSWLLAIFGFNIYYLMLVHFVVQICYNNWHWPMKAMRLMNTNLVKTIKEGSSELWSIVSKSLFGNKKATH